MGTEMEATNVSGGLAEDDDKIDEFYSLISKLDFESVLKLQYFKKEDWYFVIEYANDADIYYCNICQHEFNEKAHVLSHIADGNHKNNLKNVQNIYHPNLINSNHHPLIEIVHENEINITENQRVAVEEISMQFDVVVVTTKEENSIQNEDLIPKREEENSFQSDAVINTEKENSTPTEVLVNTEKKNSMQENSHAIADETLISNEQNTLGIDFQDEEEEKIASETASKITTTNESEHFQLNTNTIQIENKCHKVMKIEKRQITLDEDAKSAFLHIDDEHSDELMESNTNNVPIIGKVCANVTETEVTSSTQKNIDVDIIEIEDEENASHSVPFMNMDTSMTKNSNLEIIDLEQPISEKSEDEHTTESSNKPNLNCKLNDDGHSNDSLKNSPTIEIIDLEMTDMESISRINDNRPKSIHNELLGSKEMKKADPLVQNIIIINLDDEDEDVGLEMDESNDHETKDSDDVVTILNPFKSKNRLAQKRKSNVTNDNVIKEKRDIIEILSSDEENEITDQEKSQPPPTSPYFSSIRGEIMKSNDKNVNDIAPRQHLKNLEPSIPSNIQNSIAQLPRREECVIYPTFQSNNTKYTLFTNKSFIFTADVNIMGLIGVEYVVKLMNEADNFMHKYICHLCEMTFYNALNMQEHLMSNEHRTTYCELYFPTAIRNLNEFVNSFNEDVRNNIRRVMLQKLSEAIENHHGRSLPFVYLKNEYQKNFINIRKDITLNRHGSEKNGPTFTHVFDSSNTTDILEEARKIPSITTDILFEKNNSKSIPQSSKHSKEEQTNRHTFNQQRNFSSHRSRFRNDKILEDKNYKNRYQPRPHFVHRQRNFLNNSMSQSNSNTVTRPLKSILKRSSLPPVETDHMQATTSVPSSPWAIPIFGTSIVGKEQNLQLSSSSFVTNCQRQQLINPINQFSSPTGNQSSKTAPQPIKSISKRPSLPDNENDQTNKSARPSNHNESSWTLPITSTSGEDENQELLPLPPIALVESNERARAIYESIISINNLLRQNKAIAGNSQNYQNELNRFWSNNKNELSNFGVDPNKSNDWITVIKARLHEFYKNCGSAVSQPYNLQQQENDISQRPKYQYRNTQLNPMLSLETEKSTKNVHEEEANLSLLVASVKKFKNNKPNQITNLKGNRVIVDNEKEEICLLSVLRRMIALENYVGSLTEKLMGLFWTALSMKSECPSEINHRLLNNDTRKFLQLVSEKFKGVLISKLASDDHAINALKQTIQQISILLSN